MLHLLLLLAVSARPQSTPVISGRIGGSQPQAAQVTLYALGAGLARSCEEPASAQAQPDTEGWYRLAAPSPGLYRLVVASPPEPAWEIDLRPLVADMVLPPLGDSDQAPGWRPAAACVPAGAEGDISSTLRRGVVVDEQGRPLAGAVLWWEGAVASWSVSGEAGRFVVSYHRGAQLWVAARGHLCRAVHLDAAEGDLVVPLAPAMRVFGRVDDAMGRPVPAARLAFRGTTAGATTLAATTDRDGHFELDGLDPRLGYVATAWEPSHGQSRLELGPGAKSAPLVFVLSSERTVFGHLLASDETPVAGAEVELRFNGKTARTSTGSDGRFALTVTTPVELSLAARAPGFAAVVVPGLAVPPGPGDWDLGDLLLAADAGLRGRVVDGDGNPVAGARLLLLRQTPDGVVTSQSASDPAGRFAFNALAEGEQADLEVRAEGFVTTLLPGLASASEGGPLEIVLAAGIRLSGLVLDADGQPVAGALVSAVAGSGEGAGQPRLSATDADGRFDIAELPAGELSLRARRANGPAGPELRLEVAAGENRADLELKLFGEAVVAGTVGDAAGAPLAGVTVVAEVTVPERDAALLRTRTDTAGHFRLVGGLHGHWHLTASRAGYRPADQELEVVLDAADVQLRLLASPPLTGLVTDPEGRAIAAAEVRLEPRRGADGRDRLSREGSSAVSGPNGSFQLPTEGAGTYALRATAAGFAPIVDRLIAISAGEEGPLHVELTPAVGLAGRLLGLDLTELAGVELVATDGTGAVVAGRARHDGSFEFVDLSAGDWRVTAWHPGSGRRVEAVVSLVPRSAHFDLDLDFSSAAAPPAAPERPAADPSSVPHPLP